jgi:hypothetical protein
VPAAYTLEDCWQLVEEAEKYQKHCVMMENCNYDRPELLALNLSGADCWATSCTPRADTCHDLRSIKFSSEGEGLWRRAPRHEAEWQPLSDPRAGPVANCLNINRGDAFGYWSR